MKSLTYQFRRAKLANVLNLAGIALTLAGAFILLTQAIYTSQFNHCIPDCRDIYRVETKGIFASNRWDCHLSRPVAEGIGQLPIVESLVINNETQLPMTFDKNGSEIRWDMLAYDGNLLPIVGAQCVSGRLELRREDYNALIIPASLARRYFGREDVAGQDIRLKGGQSRTIVGVYRDLPDNCFVKNKVHQHLMDENKNNRSNWNYNVYIRVKPGTPRQNVEQALHDYYIKDVEEDAGKKVSEFTQEELEQLAQQDFSVTPLSETYFSGHDIMSDHGNRSVLYMQEFAIVLLILVCMVNFANFSMGQAPGRIRGLTIRKVMGAHTWHLRLHLLTEGLILGVVAWIVAMAVLYILGRQSDIVQLFTASILVTDNYTLAILILALAAVIGTVPIVYSSWYATSFAPATAMKGNVGLSPRGKQLRQWLVGIQLCVAMVMVTFMGIIRSQSHYIYHSDYGYVKDSILVFFMGDIPMAKKPVLRQELEKLPGVESVSSCMNLLGTTDQGMTWGRGNGKVHFNFRALPVDWKFLRTYGIKILEGRDFKECDTDGYIINKAMMDQYPDIQVGQPLYEGDLPVLGVCDNYRSGSTRIDNSQTAAAFVLWAGRYMEWGDQLWNICVRLRGGVNILETRHQIEAVLDRLIEGARPDITFLDDELEETYREENNFIRQMQLASMLMLTITLIGVFCLTMYETEYRRKEIAIRKVMGSTVGQVLLLFVVRYTAPLLVAFVFAAPLGYWLGGRWLENFAERTAIHWWLFPLALVFVSIVVSATVVIQSWRVATGNPTDSIKTE